MSTEKIVRLLVLVSEAEDALRQGLRDNRPWYSGTALGCLTTLRVSLEASLATAMKAER